MREILLSILVAAIAYLLGCFSTGLTVSGAKGVDIRNRGSKNTGASNVLRVMGLKSGLITFAGDFLKAALACWIGSLILPGSTFGIARYGMMLAGLFAIIGHNWPVFYGFKGGKGVLVGAGAALATEPLVCAVLLVVFLIEVAITHIFSLGSIIIAALYPVGTLINLIAHGAGVPTVVFSTICCCLMAAMVIWLHRSNIERLRNGTEYRFGQKK